MEQAKRKLPPAPGYPGEAILGALGPLARANTRELRTGLETVLQKIDTAYEAYSTTVNQIVDDMCRLLAAGHAVDVDPLIEGFLKDERAAVASKATSEKQASADLRKLAATAPDKLVVVNEVLRAALGRADRLAGLYSEARWRLMQAQAFHQPSAPSGPVRGQPIDIDEYLKTLG
ncbi:MAG: hypothetical protein ACJ8DU_12015 [Microvirga sp.]